MSAGDEQGVEGDRGTPETPDLQELERWNGARVEEIGGASVGKIDGVYVDAEGGQPAWLVLRIGRFGNRTLVPVSHAVEAAGKVWLPYDREQLRSSPRIEAGAELTREQELELCGHFGIPESSDRGAELNGRSGGSVTARPAAA